MKKSKNIISLEKRISFGKVRFLVIGIALMLLSFQFAGCTLQNVSAFSEEDTQVTAEPEVTDEESVTEEPELTPEPSQTPEDSYEPEITPSADGEETAAPEETEEATATPNPDEESTTSTPVPTEEPEQEAEATAAPEVAATTEPEATEEASAEPSDGLEVTPSPEATEEASEEASASPEITPVPEATEEAAPDTSEVPETEADQAFQENAYIITAFLEEPISLVVERGTAEKDIGLPETLLAQNMNGETIEVSVEWEMIYEQEYSVSEEELTQFEIESLCGYGPWEFEAIIDAGYSYEGESITASVSITDCMDIVNFCGVESGGMIMRFVIAKGGKVSLPGQIMAFMADGGYKAVDVTWSGDYNVNKAGTYTLTMNTSDEYGGKYATVEIVVKKAS